MVGGQRDDIHFKRNELPPVNAFGSITMHNLLSFTVYHPPAAVAVYHPYTPCAVGVYRRGVVFSR